MKKQIETEKVTNEDLASMMQRQFLSISEEIKGVKSKLALPTKRFDQNDHDHEGINANLAHINRKVSHIEQDVSTIREEHITKDEFDDLSARVSLTESRLHIVSGK